MSSVESRHVSLLKELYNELAEKLNVQNVSIKMFQNNGLTLAELESIQSQRDRPTEAARTLLNYLLHQPRDMYECFLEALKESKQNDLYIWLLNNGYQGQI